MNDTQIIAHRGASAQAPEHTWAAYDLALEQGADALEVDVRMLADGRLVALHDATLWRTAGDPRTAATLTLEDVRALPRAVRPLRLGKVLRRYAGRTWFLLDLKDPSPAMERRLCALVARLGIAESVIVQSFDAPSMRRLAGRLPVAPLFERRPSAAALQRAALVRSCGIAVRASRIDAALVADAHRRGLTVRAWTVNEPHEADVLARIGVDGLITDRPAAIRAALPAAVPLAA